jgi:hypothetical protein
MVDFNPYDGQYRDMSIQQLGSLFCVPEKLIKYRFNVD